MNIPKEHQTVMPYLMLEGALKFIDFVKTVFNASVLSNTLGENNSTVAHAEIQIGGCTIMFSDTTGDWKSQTANLFVYVENADESYQKALEVGATSLMGLSDEPYGRTCGITDPVGNVWWITSINA